MSELSEIRERFVILLLGVEDNPIPTKWHVQKEIFIFSKIHPKIQDLFHFVKHYEGPYSQLLQEAIVEPMHYENAYEFTSNNALGLLPLGKNIFQDFKMQYGNLESFIQTVNSLRLIRTIYDKLSKNELLLLMYITYPEFIEYSGVYDDLVKNDENRRVISNNLLNKGLITKDRFEELINYVS